ncbi:MAG: flagellar motor protein [Bdellovibrionales bacterium]|nr:flagellar motor protein [Bdellovibrionales bacterium]
MDFLTLIGIALGIGGIIAGQVLEGGHVGSILQFTAFLIVFGGTLGAVLIGTTRNELALAIALFKDAFQESDDQNALRVSKELIELAQIARKETILALEKKLPEVSFPFTRSVLRLMIDGVDPVVIRDVFEREIDQEEERLNAAANVYSDAGGYAPTVGIIGAVLGLIHVMENLTDTSKLGAGIAVAFVATVYGVGSANLLFFPLSKKLKKRIRDRIRIKEMSLEGAMGILQGLNPMVLDEKLSSFIRSR